MTDTPKLKPPAGLGPRGAAFCSKVAAKYEPYIDDRELLTEVCRVLDTVEDLQTRLDEKGIVTEIRLQRQLLAKLLVQLGLERPDGETMPSSASERGKKAANARWKDHVKRSTQMRLRKPPETPEIVPVEGCGHCRNAARLEKTAESAAETPNRTLHGPDVGASVAARALKRAAFERTLCRHGEES